MSARGKAHKVIAVIGDGSMTAGLAFEGLNQAGAMDKDLIVVLNDNELSISPNVGALSSYLNRLMTGQLATRFRDRDQELSQTPPGDRRFGPEVGEIRRGILQRIFSSRFAF